MPPTGIYNVFELSTTSSVTASIAGGVNNSTAATIASVIATTSGTLLQASNTSRKGLIAYSCTGSAAAAIIAYTTAVSTTNFSVVVAPGSLWEMPVPLSNLGMSVAVSTTANAGLTATLQVTELS